MADVTTTEYSTVRLMVIGAHPDDCEVRAGGLAALYRQRGGSVTFVSLTNGDAGHHFMAREALATRRFAETRAVSERFGIEYHVLDNHDGELEASLENRKQVIRLIRTCRPDLVLTHRPNDYHPDHRYTATLVQDAAFSVTVPLICDDTPALPRNPVFAYFQDAFTKPVPFSPTVAVDITAVMDQKMEMLHCHTSQFYEWLPFLAGDLAHVPAGETERRRFLYERWQHRSDPEPWRELLVQFYGETRGRTVRHAEAFEVSEYGARLDEAARRRLFGV
jgi:LmbE family N-acetylglucosaminyl deacetylase